jgi:hypothetical protein
MNGSLIKLCCKNWPISQVQTTKLKPFKKVMNIPTNIIEMISSKLRMQRKKMGSIGHQVSKIWSKQSSNIDAENV